MIYDRSKRRGRDGKNTFGIYIYIAGRDGKILSDHRQDGNDEVHRLQVRLKKKRKKKKKERELQV